MSDLVVVILILGILALAVTVFRRVLSILLALVAWAFVLFVGYAIVKLAVCSTWGLL